MVDFTGYDQQDGPPIFGIVVEHGTNCQELPSDSQRSSNPDGKF